MHASPQVVILDSVSQMVWLTPTLKTLKPRPGLSEFRQGGVTADKEMCMSVSIIGNVVRDPEVKFASTGNALLNFSIAQTRKFTGKDGKDKEETSFFDVTCFGPLAENVANSVVKGTRVMVSGRLAQNSWEDKDGNKRSKVEIVADEIGVSLRFNPVLPMQGSGQIF